MSENNSELVPLTDQQKRLYVQLYDGMTSKQPQYASDLTQVERTKIAAAVKREKKEQEKQQEEQERLNRQQQTIWIHTAPDSQGYPRAMPTLENLGVLVNKVGFVVKYNAMTSKIECFKNGRQITNEFDDIYPLVVSKAVEYDLPREGIQAYIPAVAKKSEYHPVKKIIDNTQWDGKPRLQAAVDCFNFTDRKHASAIMRKFFVGAIAALYQGNFFTKLVPVIHGAQSLKKTAALSRFFNIAPGAWLEGHSLKESSKDSVMEAVCCWCCELGEMETTTKNEQGWLKAFLPKANDTYRPPYGRGAITRKRQTVFVGTVNKHDFLKDETGSTRFAVLSTEKIDIDRLNTVLGWKYVDDRVIQTDPDQLVQFWAEVKYYFDNGEGWMQSDDELIQSQSINDAYQDKGEYHSTIEDYIAELNNTRERTTTEWMTGTQLCEHLRIPTRLNRRVTPSYRELFNHERRRGNVVWYEVPVFVTKVKELK